MSTKHRSRRATPRAPRPGATGVELDRRALLRLGGAAAWSWLLGGGLLGLPQARAGEGPRGRPPAQALIVLWLEGGASQLETFDPHPGGAIGGPTRAIPTALPGVQLAEHLPRLAERLDRLSLIRSLVTAEGEHERARTLLRTGAAPTPAVRRPAMSAVVAHELPRPELEIPGHVAFLSPHPPQGGLLGPELDAFKVGDPRDPLPDLVARVPDPRFRRRLDDLALLEDGFARGRAARVRDAQHRRLTERATSLMSSTQLAAFDYRQESASTIAAYGETAFGRSCLTARRLVEAGAPAIEVALPGWDSHVENFSAHARLGATLDQGFAALLDDLAARDLLERTIVLCAGEFGRTPRINGLDGRDHWTRGFSVALAGGGLRPGVVIGATDPAGAADPVDPVRPQDLFATIYEALGIDRGRWFDSAAGRPIQLNEGAPIARLLR